MVRKRMLHTAYPDFFSSSVFILKPCYQMAADCSLPLPWSNHALCEYYPVGLHLHLWTMTIVWLILTFQILRILRTLLEAFVFLPSQCFTLFSWILSLLFSSPVPASGLILRIMSILHSSWEAGCAEHFIQCIALSQYWIHSVDKHPALCLPPRGHQVHIATTATRLLADGTDPAGPFLLIASILMGYLEFSDSTWSGRTNHLLYPVEGIRGQTLPSASCASCIKGRLEFYAFGVGLVLWKLCQS